MNLMNYQKSNKGETVNVKINMSGWFVGTLTLIFITLKLLGKIDWSWWWVLAPLWVPVAGVLVIASIIFAFFYLSEKT